MNNTKLIINEPFFKVFTKKNNIAIYDFIDQKIISIKTIFARFFNTNIINYSDVLHQLKGENEKKDFIKLITYLKNKEVIYQTSKPIAFESLNILMQKELQDFKVTKSIDNITLKITNDCNAGCTFCGNVCTGCSVDEHQRKETLNLDMLKKKLKEISYFYPNKIILTGGDSLRFNQLDELIRLIKNYLGEIIIVLRSSLLDIYKLDDFSFIEYNNLVIESFFVDDFSKDSHKIKMFLKNYNFFKSKKVKIYVKYFHLNDNKNSSFDLNIFKDKKIEYYTVYPNKVSESDDCKNYINGVSIEKFYKNNRFHFCFSDSVFIELNGDVRPCLYHKDIIGNIYNETINSILLSKEIDSFWKKTKDYKKKCRDCLFRYACFKCDVFDKHLYKNQEVVSEKNNY